ncbi:MAG TPA: glycosyltransferase family 39 protein [Anaerolineae bacterium]|nr:glycosyltransferase family 39 protein [Anaerolineae bacterium]
MKQRRLLWALAALLLLAAGLRLFRLGAQSLWYDETVSVYLAGRSLPDLVAHTAGDIHPPGYYLLLHAWTRLAGSSELAAAYLSLCFGLLLVALAYRLGRRLFDRAAGLCAALLVAVSPFNLWYSQEVRMYTLGAALGMGALWCVVRLLEEPRGRQAAWPALAAYSVLGALGLWTLYYFAFLLVALNLLVAAWWLAGRRRRSVDLGWLGRWLAAQGLILLLYAPWLPVAWRQATHPPVPPWRSLTPAGRLFVDSWSALSLGQSADPARAWPALIVTLGLFILGLAWPWLRHRARRQAGSGRVDSGQETQAGGRAFPWLLAGYVALPVLLIWLASFVSPLYHVRYVFTYSTPFYVLVGAGLAWLWRRRRIAAWACLAILLLFSAHSVWRYHTDVRLAADDHRGATRFLQDRWRPGDAILVDAGYVYTALLSYWEGEPPVWRGRLVSSEGLTYGKGAQEGPVLLMAGTVNGDAGLGWGDPASDFYGMGLAETQAALEQVFADFHRVWVYRCYDTVTDPNGDIRAWLEEHGRRFEDQTFTGESQLRVLGYTTGRDPRAGSAPVDQELVDGSLRLTGQAGPPAAVPVGGTLDLALVWHAGALPADGRILFAGLFQDGRRWAQTDVRALGSLFPFESWQPDEQVRTPLRVPIPGGTPPGRYRLEVGWYRFVDGQPVWIPWDSGNLLLAGEVEVIPPDDWQAVPLPDVRERLGVSIGLDWELVGLDAGDRWLPAGGSVPVELVWRARGASTVSSTVALVLTDDAGRSVAEDMAGTLPPALGEGQALRSTHTLALPPDVPAGTYTLAVGLRGADGSWLPVRRGVLALGSTIPLATVHVVDAAGR